MPLKINFDGLLRSPASWAKVNRKILSALAGEDRVDLAVQPRRGFQWNRDFPLPATIPTDRDPFESPDLTLAFPFPPKMQRLEQPDAPLVVHSLYEASRLPHSWVEPLRTIPDLIVVPSKHVYRIYRREGIPESRLEIVPYGYDPDVFSPNETWRDSPDTPRIVTVATPHFRKGLDLFRSVTDLTGTVEWRIHCPFETSSSSDEFWVDPWIQEDLRARGFSLSTGSLNETAIAELLASSDLCVQPSRSEGFGLVALEAMASATPVLTTDWGGHLSFAGAGMIRLEGTLRTAGRSQYHQRQSEARVFEPDPVQFRTTLRELIDDPETLNELAEKARTSVRAMTWKATADQLVSVLMKRFG